MTDPHLDDNLNRMPAPEDDDLAPASPGRRRFLRRLLAAGAVFAPTTGYAYALEPELIRVANLDVPVPGLPKAAHGLRIGHISDTHCDGARELHRAASAARLLAAQKPDIVFVTGDYITHQSRRRMGP